MRELLKTLDAAGLRRFVNLQAVVVNAVTERFYVTHGQVYQRFGERGREFCREDLVFHLEFLRPVLEFGLLQTMVDYLRWLNEVLISRGVPAGHLGLSLDWLAEEFSVRMEETDGDIVVAALIAAREGFLETVETPLMTLLPAEPWPEMNEFQLALLSGNHIEAQAILKRSLAAGCSLIDFELHIIQPALYDIGEKWQANQVSVAQEHLATAIAQSVMSVGLQHSQLKESVGKRVLLACVEGNNHAVGLQMVADAFLLAGWEVQYLGANVPVSSLISQSVAWKPDLIGLSVSFPQQVRVARATINQLSEQFGAERPAVMIGGLAFNRFSGLSDVVGADSCFANSRQAVEYVSGSGTER